MNERRPRMNFHSVEIIEICVDECVPPGTFVSHSGSGAGRERIKIPYRSGCAL